MKKLRYIFLLFLFPSLPHITNATNIFYVTTDNYHNPSANSSFHNLQYYINNANKYFTSNTYLYFLPGQHHLNTDFIINSTTNFTVAGNHSIITCTAPASIRVINVTDFTLTNIDLFHCGKDNEYYVYTNYLNVAYPNKHIPTGPMKCNISILLDKCTSVTITNVSIDVRVGYAGLFAVNMKNSSTITNLKVHVNCSTCPQFYRHISGIIFYYYTISNSTKQNQNSIINLFHYQYKTHGSCPYKFQYAITLLPFQKHYNVSVNIQSIALKNLKNASLLYYSGEIGGNGVICKVTIKDSMICNNIGNTQLKMFHIVLNNYREIIKDLSFLYYNQQQTTIDIINCTFTNNTNMAAMIYVTPGSSRVISAYIEIIKVVFCNNRQLHFITVKSTNEIIWQLTTHIKLVNVQVLSNKHSDGNSLISVTNGVIYFVGPVICTNNSYYRNIIELHLSIAVGKRYIKLTNNNARQILQAKSSSYLIIEELTTVNMSANTVYMVAKQARTFGDDSRPICPIQFHNYRRNIDKDPSTRIDTLYKILMLRNMHMMSKYLPGEDMSFGNCTWLAGTAFRRKPAKLVYQQVLKFTNIPINKTTKRSIPLSVCPCINSTDYDCYSPNLGLMFPGQTINIKLLVGKKWLIPDNPFTTLMVANTPDDDCSVVDSHQLSQTHFNHGCNNYRYTIWPSNEHRTECKLYLGLNGMPEMFYIEMKPCPKGFTLDKDTKACNCDPLLDNKILPITSCDLDDETILRPANSWITADTVNGAHTYLVSSSCPLDYCLPYSSHHKLSDPDSQCRYNRSGMLCGQCKQGFSSILGAPQCKKCSNIYLLLIIPIGILGVILVILLFMLPLTVTNGTITSFIFYFNTIHMNYVMFFPGCHSIVCTAVTFINLDFSTKTCFYNGMDEYALIWLLLAFPTYLIVIATVLIVMSRYFTIIQRITAKKALPVLATLFLLSYTKLLRIVCRALFRYITVTHLPSNHTTVVWLLSTDTPLFELKFFFVFIVCIIIFSILLFFNVILLFTRKLSRFKFVTYFKPLLDPYFAPYKDNTFYWTGLLLLIRTVILALLAFAKDVSLTAIIILLGGILWWHGIAKPFRSKFENIQESVLILILLAAHAVLSCNEGFKVAQIFITISVVYFLLILFFYCFIFRFKSMIQLNAKKVYDMIRKILGLLSDHQDTIEMKTFSDNIADVTYNYKEFREPLVEYDK